MEVSARRVRWDRGSGRRALRKVPYVAVIGPREAANGQVALRLRDGRELPPMPVAAALDLIGKVVAKRSFDLSG